MTEFEFAGALLGMFFVGFLFGLICAMWHVESELKKEGINIEL